MRHVCIDTETTGLSPKQGDRLIEVAALEMIDRRLTGRKFHAVLDPEREISAGATKVHGKVWADLKGEAMLFEEVAAAFVDFTRGATWVIHNAPFDIGFLDHELELAGQPPTSTIYAGLIDTMRMEGLSVGGSLNKLCDRYGISREGRDVHGAVIDATLLAHVYAAMTAGQMDLAVPEVSRMVALPLSNEEINIIVIQPTAEELAAHEVWLTEMEAAFGKCVWRELAA